LHTIDIKIAIIWVMIIYGYDLEITYLSIDWIIIYNGIIFY
jgi:hypothetical protein